MLNPRLAIFAAAALSLFALPGADTQGCQSQPSSDVAQDKIHTNYWLYRESNSDVTYARAQFRFGTGTGTSLELTGGASVSEGGTPLPWGALLDWYENKHAGYTKQTTFTYVDSEGKRREVPVPVIREVSFPDPLPAKLPRSESFELTWVGEPLADGETMEAVVARDANRLDFAVWYETKVGARSMVLTKDGLAKVQAGASVLSLRRHRNYPLPAGADTGGGGRVTTTFQPLDHPFVLE